MRPKKVILLIDADEERSGITRFLLETYRFEVHAFRNAAEAMNYSGRDPGCVLAYWPFFPLETEKVARAGRCPLVVIEALGMQLPWNVVPDAVLSRSCPNSELVERMKACCARRPGPAVGWRRNGAACDSRMEAAVAYWTAF